MGGISEQAMQSLKAGDYVWVRFADRGRQIAVVIDVHPHALTVSKYRKSSGRWTQWRYVFPSDVQGSLSDKERESFINERLAAGYTATWHNG